jgi:cis-3-alkyl-4-acyloxetan-2-one decarboxylase
MTTSTDWRLQYPFTSREMSLGGFRCHYVDEGRGPAVLCVHGNPTWSFYWRRVIEALRDRCRVVAVDHIGCGLSEKPDRRRYPYTLARRVEDLCGLIERLDLGEITLVAHDWGGAIGMGTAVAMPERFARFALMNTAAFRSDRCPWRIRVCRVPVLGRLGVQGLSLFARAALRMAVARPERLSAEARAGLLAPYDSWSHRTAIQQFVLDIPLRGDHPSYAKLAEIEAGLRQFRDRPVCLIWGMRDWCFTPHFLERFIERWPQAEVHRLEEAGHYVVEDAPEEVVEHLRRFIPAAGGAGT